MNLYIIHIKDKWTYTIYRSPIEPWLEMSRLFYGEGFNDWDSWKAK